MQLFWYCVFIELYWLFRSFYFKQGFNYLFEVPHNKGISTADFWNKGVDWIFDTFFVYIKTLIRG